MSCRSMNFYYIFIICINVNYMTMHGTYCLICNLVIFLQTKQVLSTNKKVELSQIPGKFQLSQSQQASVKVPEQKPTICNNNNLSAGSENYGIKKENKSMPTNKPRFYSSLVKIAYKSIFYNVDICESASCEIYPPRVYKFAGKQKIDISEGILITKCNQGAKHQFISKILKAQTDSWKFCCSLGMSPGIIESKEELNCLYEEYKKSIDSTFSKAHRIITDYNDRYKNGEFYSCNEGNKRVPDELWGENEPRNVDGMMACAADDFSDKRTLPGPGLFEGFVCVDPVHMLCQKIVSMKDKKLPSYSRSLRTSFEISSDGSTVAAYDFCSKNKCAVNTVFDLDFVLKLVNVSKGLVFKTCGKRVYYLSNIKISGTEIWGKCCEIGMVPATISSESDMICIYNNLMNSLVSDKINFPWLKQFLVAYMDYKLDFNYTSCPDKLEVPSNLWAANQPDNLKGIENCVLAHFPYTIRNMGYHDIACHMKFFYMCQSPNEYTEATTSATQQNSEAQTNSITNIYSSQIYDYFASQQMLKCEAFFCNEKLVPMKPLVDNIRYIENQNNVVIKDCGSKLYLFSKRKVSFIDSWQECCSWGMIPASIESRDEIKCLKKYYTKPVDNEGVVYFTAQLDAYLDRRMVSCASGNAVPSDVWYEGQPNNDMKKEACVALKIDNKSAGLFDIRCGEYINVVCESTKSISKYFPTSRVFTTTNRP